MGEPTGESAPTNGVPASLAAGRAATLAALQAGPVEVPADAVEAAPTDPATADAPAEPGEVAVASTAPAEKTDKAEKAADEKPDPETDKRLARVQAAQKRAEESLAKQRAELEARAKDLESRAGTAEKFGSLKERIASGDRTAFLEAMEQLGLTEDHYEDHAKLLYSNRKGAEAKDRAAATALLEKREVKSEASKALAEVEKLRAELRARDEAAEAQQLQHAYLSDVTKTATLDTTEAPLLKAALSKNPAKATGALWATAQAIFEAEGEWPDSATVVSTFEKNKRAELEEFGFTPAANTTTKPTTEAKKSPTLGSDLAGNTKPTGARKTLQEQRDETRALIAAGKVEP